jgi:hypothetical protein
MSGADFGLSRSGLEKSMRVVRREQRWLLTELRNTGRAVAWEWGCVWNPRNLLILSLILLSFSHTLVCTPAQGLEFRGPENQARHVSSTPEDGSGPERPERRDHLAAQEMADEPGEWRKPADALISIAKAVFGWFYAMDIHAAPRYGFQSRPILVRRDVAQAILSERSR